MRVDIGEQWETACIPRISRSGLVNWLGSPSRHTQVSAYDVVLTPYYHLSAGIQGPVRRAIGDLPLLR